MVGGNDVTRGPSGWCGNDEWGRGDDDGWNYCLWAIRRDKSSETPPTLSFAVLPPGGYNRKEGICAPG